ncbi:MAG TPA: hypothetical protein VFH83_09705 [Spirochaetia bacterium]|nr:hypothetical protein [Spirochaetia bacterium]
MSTRSVQPTLAAIRASLPGEELQRSTLPPLIEMRVEEQNHRVGFRNVHRIPAGSARTVGGGFSSFLVFLVPMPGSIAEIRNENGTFVFRPLRAELFPDVPGPVENCLDRRIPFMSPKGMPLTLVFRPWVSPLDEVNAILRQARPREG